MKHTPGPWKLAEIVEAKHTKTNRRRIRSVNEGLEHGAVCEVYGAQDGSEAHANACLILAAPCLLKALQQIIKGVPDTWPAVEQAKSAIRKATGDD